MKLFDSVFCFSRLTSLLGSGTRTTKLNKIKSNQFYFIPVSPENCLKASQSVQQMQILAHPPGYSETQNIYKYYVVIIDIPNSYRIIQIMLLH